MASTAYVGGSPSRTGGMPCDLSRHTASSSPCDATVRRPIMTIVFADPVRGRIGAGQSSEDREVVAALCIGRAIARQDRHRTAEVGTNLAWPEWSLEE